jgi:hypothetical protein
MGRDAAKAASEALVSAASTYLQDVHGPMHCVHEDSGGLHFVTPRVELLPGVHGFRHGVAPQALRSYALADAEKRSEALPGHEVPRDADALSPQPRHMWHQS